MARIFFLDEIEARELAMKSKRRVQWTAIASIVLVGCAATRQYPAPPIIPATRLVESGQATTSTSWQYGSGALGTASVPRNVLVLSGGGMNGAYVAGVLKGWTVSGTRPQFDIVTGVSTGALIAPYAFLGPEYDNELQRACTVIGRIKSGHWRAKLGSRG